MQKNFPDSQDYHFVYFIFRFIFSNLIFIIFTLVRFVKQIHA